MNRSQLILFSFLLLFLFSYQKEENINDQPIGDLTPISSGEIIHHIYDTFSFSEENEQAYWVFYRLTPDFLNSAIERTEDFREDPLFNKFT